MNNIGEVDNGVKEYQAKIIGITLKQHELSQRMAEWKRNIENKEETLKLAIEKEEELVAQEMFEEGERVKEMVDALNSEIESLS